MFLNASQQVRADNDRIILRRHGGICCNPSSRDAGESPMNKLKAGYTTRTHSRQATLHYTDTPSERKQNIGKDLSGFSAQRTQPPVPLDNMDQHFKDGEGKPLRVLGLTEGQVGG